MLDRLSQLFERNGNDDGQNNIDGREQFIAAVAPQALEIDEDRIRFPNGTLLPLAVREAGTPGDASRPMTNLHAGELLRDIPAFYSATFRRELPDTLRGTLRAKRTVFEGVLMALAEKTGRRPSSAEQATDQALDAAESALARGAAAFNVCLLLGLFTPNDAAERMRRELESRLRAKRLLPQRFQYVTERALLTLQPGGHLFHGIEESTLLLNEAVQLLPTPRRRVMPANDAIRIGRHARLSSDVYYSFTRGLDPTQPPPPHAVTLVLGEMGSGKTTLVRLMMLQRLLQGRTVVTLDPEGENNRLCEALGGTIIPTTPPDDDETCLLHPLIAESAAEMYLAARFLTAAVAGDGGLDESRAKVNAALHEAVQKQWERRPGRMRVIDLVETLELVSGTLPQGAAISSALRPYAKGGLFEGFFDRNTARLSTDLPPGTWINFDLSGLREENRRIVHAVLSWFFYHTITAGKRPIDIFIDEGWRLLRGGAFTEMLDELSRRARKRGVGVVLVTHLPSDLAKEDTSLKLAATSFVGRLGPDEAFAFFRSLGVSQNESQRRAETVANLPPKMFLAAPAGGRSALFPVEVQVPHGWLQLFDQVKQFEGMTGHG